MKRLVGIFAALVISFGAVACGPQETVSPETTTKSHEEVYLDVVRSEYPYTADISDDLLVDFAVEACAAMDRGASGMQIMDAVMDNAANMAQAEAHAFMVGAGVAVYCPQHSQKIESAAGWQES